MAGLLPKSKNRSDAPPAHPPAKSVKPLVLVVEDHDDTRFMLEYLLGIRGCRVTVAEDGEMAVRIAESQRPDLILMDASLPRLDGLSATRRIRELAALHDVPIVFLTGHAHPSFGALVLETGGNDFIVKPFQLEQLERVLERHLGINGKGLKAR
jgi:two-component system cell cycle response regulator DivK